MTYIKKLQSILDTRNQSKEMLLEEYKQYKAIYIGLMIFLFVMLIAIGFSSTAYAEDLEVSKIESYIEYLEVNEGFCFEEMTYVDYYTVGQSEKSENNGRLVLDIKDNYYVSMIFHFFIEHDEIEHYENSTYYYDIHKDVLIIFEGDTMIYNDLDN